MSKVVVGKEEVNLDEGILHFSPETMNEFLAKYASLYKYFHEQHARASLIVKKMDDLYHQTYSRKFRDFKANNGYSDKMAEACAKADEEVVDVRASQRGAEFVKDSIQGFLRSMDNAHDNAKEMCYNMRKELDKIYPNHIAARAYERRMLPDNSGGH